ncbi:MAG: hypothetical protein VB980_04095 [Opitutales bacterium]|jgi:hypothetical protein
MKKMILQKIAEQLKKPAVRTAFLAGGKELWGFLQKPKNKASDPEEDWSEKIAQELELASEELERVERELEKAHARLIKAQKTIARRNLLLAVFIILAALLAFGHFK